MQGRGDRGARQVGGMGIASSASSACARDAGCVLYDSPSHVASLPRVTWSGALDRLHCRASRIETLPLGCHDVNRTGLTNRLWRYAAWMRNSTRVPTTARTRAFGKRIRELRNKKKWSQAKLAAESP